MKWFDTASAAYADVKEDLEADGWIVCETSEGFVAEPPPGRRLGGFRRIVGEIIYSEARDQYRAYKAKQ